MMSNIRIESDLLKKMCAAAEEHGYEVVGFCEAEKGVIYLSVDGSGTFGVKMVGSDFPPNIYCVKVKKKDRYSLELDERKDYYIKDREINKQIYIYDVEWGRRIVHLLNEDENKSQ